MKIKDLQFDKRDFFAIPNILTYVRFLLVPTFAAVYLNAHTMAGHIWSIAIVLLSGATDILDGIIARKCQMITDLGKIIDPIADKAFQLCMMFCIIVRYPLVIALIVLYGLKELISLAFSSWLLHKGKHIAGANWAGKLCTVVLYFSMLVLIAVPEQFIKGKPLLYIVLSVAAAFMILAFVVYMHAYMNLYRELKREQK